MPSFGLKVIRFGFSSVGRVSPRTAARLAFRLFCLTPSRRPKGEKAKKAVVEGRQRLEVAEKLPFPTPHGKVMAYRFKGRSPDARRYLLVHGWGSGADYISGLAQGLARNGAEVVVLDFPGHGRSSGRQLHMRMAVDTIIEAQERFGPFDGAVGHSFGGSSLMLAAGGVMRGAGQLMAGKLAVIGSPSEVEWLFRDFSHMVGLTPKTGQELLTLAEDVAGCGVADFDTVAIAGKLARPILVIHAEDDKEVSVEHARRYVSAGPHVRFHWANGYGHRRIVSAPSVISAVSSFMEREEDTAAA